MCMCLSTSLLRPGRTAEVGCEGICTGAVYHDFGEAGQRGVTSELLEFMPPSMLNR